MMALGGSTLSEPDASLEGQSFNTFSTLSTPVVEEQGDEAPEPDSTTIYDELLTEHDGDGLETDK